MFLAVRSRDVAFAGLERQRGRHLISRSDTPKLWREFWAGQAEMAPRFRPDLEFGRDAPLRADVRRRDVAGWHGGPADVIVRHAAVHLESAADALNEAHARVLAIDALERKLFVGMLRAQLGTAELEAGPNARLGEAGLQRDVGRVRELTADVHVTRADRQRPVEQAITRLRRRCEPSRIASLRIGDFAADVERADPEQPHVSAD